MRQRQASRRGMCITERRLDDRECVTCDEHGRGVHDVLAGRPGVHCSSRNSALGHRVSQYFHQWYHRIPTGRCSRSECCDVQRFTQLCRDRGDDVRMLRVDHADRGSGPGEGCLDIEHRPNPASVADDRCDDLAAECRIEQCPSIGSHGPLSPHRRSVRERASQREERGLVSVRIGVL